MEVRVQHLANGSDGEGKDRLYITHPGKAKASYSPFSLWRKGFWVLPMVVYSSMVVQDMCSKIQVNSKITLWMPVIQTYDCASEIPIHYPRDWWVRKEISINIYTKHHTREPKTILATTLLEKEIVGACDYIVSILLIVLQDMGLVQKTNPNIIACIQRDANT